MALNTPIPHRSLQTHDLAGIALKGSLSPKVKAEGDRLEAKDPRLLDASKVLLSDRLSTQVPPDKGIQQCAASTDTPISLSTTRDRHSESSDILCNSLPSETVSIAKDCSSPPDLQGSARFSTSEDEDSTRGYDSLRTPSSTVAKSRGLPAQSVSPAIPTAPSISNQTLPSGALPSPSPLVIAAASDILLLIRKAIKDLSETSLPFIPSQAHSPNHTSSLSSTLNQSAHPQSPSRPYASSLPVSGRRVPPSLSPGSPFLVPRSPSSLQNTTNETPCVNSALLSENAFSSKMKIADNYNSQMETGSPRLSSSANHRPTVSDGYKSHNTMGMRDKDGLGENARTGGGSEGHREEDDQSGEAESAEYELLLMQKRGGAVPRNWQRRDPLQARQQFIDKFSCRKRVYENCRIYGNTGGRLLCFCDKKKLQWYVSRGLAEYLSDEPPSIRLLFEPKGQPDDVSNEFYLQSKENRCVACGEASHYLRYRLVPSCYRQHYPEHLKSHRSHDIVLLCVDCHEVAHKAAEKCKRQLAIEMGIPLSLPMVVSGRAEVEVGGEGIKGGKGPREQVNFVRFQGVTVLDAPLVSGKRRTPQCFGTCGPISDRVRDTSGSTEECASEELGGGGGQANSEFSNHGDEGEGTDREWEENGEGGGGGDGDKGRERDGVDPRLLRRAAMAILKHGERMPYARREELMSVIRQYYGKVDVDREELEQARTVGLGRRWQQKARQGMRNIMAEQEGSGKEQGRSLVSDEESIGEQKGQTNMALGDEREEEEADGEEGEERGDRERGDLEEEDGEEAAKEETTASRVHEASSHSEGGLADSKPDMPQAQFVGQFDESKRWESKSDQRYTPPALTGHGWHGLKVVNRLLSTEGEGGGEGALREFNERWRQVFVEALQPRFLPPGWDIKHRGNREFGKFSVFNKEGR
eukprot:TRINITY_DN4772_c0_g2_i1.p1 TRINITY_DN4772_c0_g2~~TRINITY_DN4772_c0_g2_i1.p1  ORF type:complete len:969 (+),score=144.85 TRINITY_DN4772_c0_g2_i1:140-2908(+)